MTRVVVVGGGLCGAWAAVCAGRAGAAVTLVRRAPGATAVSSGAIDLVPPGEAADPEVWLRRLGTENPGHPYLVSGVPAIAELEATGVELAAALGAAGLPLRAGLRDPVLVMAPTGQLRRSGLCQATIAAGDLRSTPTVAVVGIGGCGGSGLPDAGAVAAALRQRRGIEATALRVAPPRALDGDAADLDVPGVARAIEAPGGAEELGAAIAAQLPRGAELALLPAVLGLDDASATAARVAAAAGLRVAEMLSAPPSAPGWRLWAAIERLLAQNQIEVVAGRVTDVAVSARRATAVRLAAGAELPCDALVLAGGRFIGGGLTTDMRPREPLLDLPVFVGGVEVSTLAASDLVSRARYRDQPVLGAGLRLDAERRPIDRHGFAPLVNVSACGALLAGLDTTLGAGGLGVGVVTAALAGRAAAGPLGAVAA